MLRRKIHSMALFALSLALASCAAPKPAVVVEKPLEKKQEKPPESIAPEPEMPALPSDDVPRLPGMLDLPSDTAFRPSNPVLPKINSGGVVIRPPTDPPSRVKPKDPAAE